MSFVGGLLIGWGLTQCAMHVRFCADTYWTNGDRWIVAGLLAIAGVGAAVLVLA